MCSSKQYFGIYFSVEKHIPKRLVGTVSAPKPPVQIDGYSAYGELRQFVKPLRVCYDRLRRLFRAEEKVIHHLAP
ncbi:MAG: hypothetical protein LBM98_08635 [Oscillospiraceae bacterium]|nr:hypothetical protein [Oscillospiraceae bacterium]